MSKSKRNRTYLDGNYESSKKRPITFNDDFVVFKQNN